MSHKKKLLLVGATGGVGQAAAQQLTQAGWTVIASCRTAKQAKALIAGGLCADTVRLSLDQPATIDAAFEQLVRAGHADLDAVVNCAAVTEPCPLELSSRESVQRTLDINLLGPLQLVQRALPELRKRRGRVVFVGSTAGSVAAPLLGSYNASKFALEALTDTLRRELRQWQVSVSLVIPAGIRTPMTTQHFAQIDAAIAAAATPLQRDYIPLYRQHRAVIRLTDTAAVSPDRVAADIVRALTDARPRTRYLSGLPSLAARTMRRLVPDQVFDEFFDRVPQAQDEPAASKTKTSARRSR